MPITITPGIPSGVFGVGVQITAQSDLPFPLPPDLSIQATVFADSEETQEIGNCTIPSPFGGGSWQLLVPQTDEPWTFFPTFVPKDGQTATVRVNLLDSESTQIDTGILAAPWSTTVGLPYQIEQTRGGAGGGLTDEQSLQLSQTWTASWPSELLDDLTLIPLSPGPSQGPLNAFLPDTVFGVIVRMATVDPLIFPVTPDGDYWYETIAVVRVYRGSDLWLRIPIHTSSKICGFITENVVSAVAAFTATEWLLNMSVQVSFRENCTGEAFLMRFP